MTIRQRQLILAYFDCLPVSGVDGIWGPQSEGATRNLQKKLGITEDGKWSQTTESTALTALVNGREPEASGSWWDDILYFTPGEFACKCGKYCDGFPYELQPQLVRIADRARKHFGQPITIVSGLRCRQHNANVGGVSNSQHMYGEAADIYVRGVHPDTVLAWFQSQSDVRYAYRIDNSDNIHFDIAKGAR